MALACIGHVGIIQLFRTRIDYRIFIVFNNYIKGALIAIFALVCSYSLTEVVPTGNSYGNEISVSPIK